MSETGICPHSQQRFKVRVSIEVSGDCLVVVRGLAGISGMSNKVGPR